MSACPNDIVAFQRAFVAMLVRVVNGVTLSLLWRGNHLGSPELLSYGGKCERRHFRKERPANSKRYRSQNE